MSSSKLMPILTAALLLATGCRDMGLGELEEAEVAAQSGVTPLVQQVHPVSTGTAPSEMVQVAGANWASANVVHTLPREIMQPVGSAGGKQFYRLAWDEPPHDRIFAEEPHGFVEYGEVY